MREPEDDHAPAEDADDDQQRAARVAPSGRRVSMIPASERTDGRSAAQDAEPDRPDLEHVAGEERQQRDGAAEEDRDEVERDRTEQHRRPAHEEEAGEQSRRAGCPPASSGACSTTRGLIVETAAIATSEERDAGPVDELGLTAKSRPPSAGPVTTVAWPTVERMASALVSSSTGTSVGGIERAAGLPSAAAIPLANESARNGQSSSAPLRLTTKQAAVIKASMASDAMKTSFRDSRSASAPAGSASSGSGRNSASPTSPR